MTPGQLNIDVTFPFCPGNEWQFPFVDWLDTVFPAVAGDTLEIRVGPTADGNGILATGSGAISGTTTHSCTITMPTTEVNKLPPGKSVWYWIDRVRAGSDNIPVGYGAGIVLNWAK